jgi:hypothetical protein
MPGVRPPPTAPPWAAWELPPGRPPALSPTPSTAASHGGRAYLKAKPEYLREAAGWQATQALTVMIPPAVKPERARVAAKSRRPRRPRVVAAGVITGAVLGAVIGLHVLLRSGGDSVQLGWYGSAVSALIGAKLLLSLLARPARDTPGRYRSRYGPWTTVPGSSRRTWPSSTLPAPAPARPA